MSDVLLFSIYLDDYSNYVCENFLVAREPSYFFMHKYIPLQLQS